MQGIKAYTRLSQSERKQLFLLHHDGVSVREIAKRLGRTHSTIPHEFKRQGGDGYSPVAAHHHARKRRGDPRKHKLDDSMLRSHVIARLGDGWSPEQITGQRMSRHQAKREVRGDILRQTLAKEGIVIEAGSVGGIAEEAPIAYKNIDEVVNVVHTAGIAKKVARLKPIAVIKG